jgi:hypothetical protein
MLLHYVELLWYNSLNKTMGNGAVVMQFDYSRVLLDKRERKIFKRFKRSDTAVLTKNEFELLRKKDLVKGVLDGQSDWFKVKANHGICEISDNGRDYRLYKQFVAKSVAIEWVRYAVTTAIAVAAFIESFFF